MKRLITIVTYCILLGYALIVIFPAAPSFIQKSYIGKTKKKVKKAIGMGILFNRESALISKSVSYRFYQNGKWQQNRLLLEPLFNDYNASGNFAALKHCRLDSHLIGELQYIGKHKGIPAMLKSKAYAEFLDHLIYRHNGNIKPDSLEMSYYEKNYETDKLNLSLTFKCKT